MICLKLLIPLVIQAACYASWRPNPGVTYADAFSISWENQFFYTFPPFSLIALCLQKISMEKAEGIMIVPVWPTQLWYSQLIRLIMDVPRTLPRSINHAHNARAKTQDTPTHTDHQGIP